MNALEKDTNGKNKKNDSSRQGGQTKKGANSSRYSEKGGSNQCKDSSDYSDCKG